nr:hypothetical protein [uncultured Pseudomonas sp.]
MTDQEQLSKIQSYVWTLELLSEALIERDEALECDSDALPALRKTAGIHQAIKIISQLAGEECGKLISPRDKT